MKGGENGSLRQPGRPHDFAIPIVDAHHHLWDLKALCTRIEDGLKRQQPPAPALMQDYADAIARVMLALESQAG